MVVAEVQMSGGRNLPGGWRTDPALAGLGTINNIGVHAFDVLRYLIGAEVTEVTALVDAEPGFQVDTTALVLLRFSTGTLGYVNANQSVPYARDDIVLYGTEGRVLGRNLSRPGRDGTLSIVTADGTRELPASTRDAYRHTVAAFADAVLAGRDPSPSGAGRAAQRGADRRHRAGHRAAPGGPGRRLSPLARSAEGSPERCPSSSPRP